MDKNNQKIVENKLIIKQILEYSKEAALSSYGVLGICQIKTKKGYKEDFIEISVDDDLIDVSLHLITAPHLKITEVLRSCSKTVRTVLNHYYPKKVRIINVFADEVSYE